MALLSAAADDNDDSSPASRSSASPSLVHEKLHYEAESHEARRAALQREGIAHGLASPDDEHAPNSQSANLRVEAADASTDLSRFLRSVQS